MRGATLVARLAREWVGSHCAAQLGETMGGGGLLSQRTLAGVRELWGRMQGRTKGALDRNIVISNAFYNHLFKSCDMK